LVLYYSNFKYRVCKNLKKSSGTKGLILSKWNQVVHDCRVCHLLYCLWHSTGSTLLLSPWLCAWTSHLFCQIEQWKDYSTTVFVQNLRLRPGAPMPLLVNTQLQEELHQIDLRHVPERSHQSDLRQVTHAQRIQEFLLLLAVCNTVVVSRHPHHDTVNLIICVPV
jgi:hypothetical protein